MKNRDAPIKNNVGEKVKHTEYAPMRPKQKSPVSGQMVGFKIGAMTHFLIFNLKYFFFKYFFNQTKFPIHKVWQLKAVSNKYPIDGLYGFIDVHTNVKNTCFILTSNDCFNLWRCSRLIRSSICKKTKEIE